MPHVFNETATRLNAIFSIEEVGGRPNVVIYSRGGARGAANERNTDYGEGLELILARAGTLGMVVEDALVDSKVTSNLPPEKRRLSVPRRPYPIHIADSDDASSLRLALQRSQIPIGQAVKSRGGNSTKKIRLIFAAYPIGTDNATLVGLLQRPSAKSREVLLAGGPAPRQDVEYARIVRDTEVSMAVKRLHDFRCQVCGIRLETPAGPYAECAHIRPLGSPHNGPDVIGNVLCLCPNHHVLFDNGAFTIRDDLVLEGIEGMLRDDVEHRIDCETLAYHRAWFLGYLTQDP